MSSLRVVNVSPRGEEQTQNYTNIHSEILDSPLSTPPREATYVAPFSPTRMSSREQMSSPLGSLASASVVDAMEEHEHQQQHQERQYDQFHEPTKLAEDAEIESEQDSYNLRPPPPARPPNSFDEALAELFFSSDHLDLILRDHSLSIRFAEFLGTYRPQHLDRLKQYTEAKKALAAVNYANAIANRMAIQYGQPIVAAKLDECFEARTKQLAEDVVEEAFPAYLTHSLVSMATDHLVKDITGNSAPVLRELIPSLAEVYCISDPSLPDNPIVYASEEFYSTTLYSRDYVIGRNCRFLQGPRTSISSMRRLVDALTQGEECCETILNYRRDGTPFMNLLMIAPLFDNKGSIRYFLGAQIDVSSLIEGGKGLDSFAQLLAQDRADGRSSRRSQGKTPKQALRDLGQLLRSEETDAMNSWTREMSIPAYQSLKSMNTGGRPTSRSSRIILGMDLAAPGSQAWQHSGPGPSCRLPGVYQNYLLVRPYPSLRITFTSPTLRIPGLLQSKLLDHIGGPDSIRPGLLEAFSQGTGVTAKVTWFTAGSDSLDHGKIRWIHCTPLLGSDERVGVWVVIMVENELVTGGLNRYSQVITPGVDSVQGAQRYTGAKLYADYLRREGRPGTGETAASTSSTRERRNIDEVFRDF